MDASADAAAFEDEAQLAAFEHADKLYRAIHRAQEVATTAPEAPQPPAPKATAPTKTAPKKTAPKKTAPKHAWAPKHATTTKAVPAAVAPPSGAAGVVVSYALAQVGKRYVYATAGPNTFDCSGLVDAAYARVGIRLPHQSEQIAARGHLVPAGQWMPGDVIHTSGHVAIYLGGGRMVEAANPSAGVRIAPVRGGTAYRFL